MPASKQKCFIVFKGFCVSIAFTKFSGVIIFMAWQNDIIEIHTVRVHLPEGWATLQLCFHVRCMEMVAHACLLSNLTPQ